MISRTPGWSWTVCDGVVTLAPRGDLRCGHVRYRERVQPLRSVDAIVERWLRDTGASESGDIETLTTDEGEYAAIVRARDRDACERTLGIVLADDWYAEVDALARRAEQFAAFGRITRELVQKDRLMLGVRRRRVRHVAPAGWLHDEPLPMFARYRRGDDTLVLYAALPVPAGVPESFDMLGGPPAPATILRSLAARTPVSIGGLSGTAWELEIRDDRARAMARRLVMLRDDRYLYAAYVDVPLARFGARRACVDALLATIDPIPPPVRGSQRIELFDGLY